MQYWHSRSLTSATVSRFLLAATFLHEEYTRASCSDSHHCTHCQCCPCQAVRHHHSQTHSTDSDHGWTCSEPRDPCNRQGMSVVLASQMHLLSCLQITHNYMRASACNPRQLLANGLNTEVLTAVPCWLLQVYPQFQFSSGSQVSEPLSYSAAAPQTVA